MRVLIVEDHRDLAVTIADGLRREGMAVDVAFDGQEGLRHGIQDTYDVVVLDRDLPGLHGDEVCRALVASAARARVLMLTAADTIESRVDGLSLGADDYLPKPFAFAELVARIRALARRGQPVRSPVLACGEIQLDTIHRVATRGGRRLDLSPKELTVLELLLAADGAADHDRGAAAPRLGRIHRRLQQRRQGHDQPPAAQARRPRSDRDRASRRLPHPHMKRPQIAARVIGRWRSLPPRTIRLRLTAVYAGLFLACGAGLLAINYALVSGRLTSDYFEKVTFNAGQAQLFIAREGSLGSGNAAFPAPVSIRSRVSRSGRAHGQGFTGLPLVAGKQTGAALQLPSQAVTRAISIATSNAAQGALLIESGIALAIMALLAAGLGWVIAGRALRPLRTITATAREISASNLHRRLALAGPNDELRQLGNTFDELLERLESAFSAQRQFAANVSHELRTPLTYERTLIEVALADPNASGERLRAVLDQLLAAGEAQERLIDSLLVLSRSQRGLDHHEPVDLGALTAHTLEHLDAGELTVVRSLAPARTAGDPRLIERLAANLLTNAVQYNEPGGRVDVATSMAEHRAILRVSNSGPAIAPGDVSRLFEPFQRIDGSRASGGEGLGLGLSIVKAIADAHGATIATTLPDGGGLSIAVAFPVQDSGPD